MGKTEHANDVRESVRRMWVAESKSYTEIADILGVSRSTISGLVHRMKLPKRNPTPYARIEPPRPKRPPMDRLVRPVSAPQEPSPPNIDPILLDGKPITVMNVTKDHCRWPISGEGINLQFCGHTPREGGQYCSSHTVRSLDPQASQRFRKNWGL